MLEGLVTREATLAPELVDTITVSGAGTDRARARLRAHFGRAETLLGY